MITMPTTYHRTPASGLLSLAEVIFKACGMEESDAHLLADALVAADLRGVHSHGVLRVPDYVRKLTTGGVDPRGRPSIVRESGACFVVDGNNSMGQVGAQFAVDLGLERAAKHAISAVSIGGSNHCGAMAYYAMQALPHDMIGFAATSSLAVMPPFGGLQPMLGINPIAVAIPAGQERPIVHDAAFSGASHGKIRIYEQEGRTLPEGWALDSQGRPTTDPSEAIHGMLQPIGGFKGVALAMLTGMLCTFLSGASFGTELGDRQHGPRPGEDGHFVGFLRIDAFEEVERFKSRVDTAIRQIHSCPRAPGVERIYLPGEIEAERHEEYARVGIPLNTTTLADLRTAAEGLRIPIPEWLDG